MCWLWDTKVDILLQQKVQLNKIYESTELNFLLQIDFTSPFNIIYIQMTRKANLTFKAAEIVKLQRNKKNIKVVCKLIL